MVSFRRVKHKSETDEQAAASEAPGAEMRDPEQEGVRVRVNDRRRLRVDEEGGGAAGDEEAGPSRKPTYVEELETRTRAAEQQARDVQTRFEQVRAELRRETDEMRQRLNRNADERAGREKANFVTAILPTLDNLRRAVEAAESGGSKESLLDGLRGTISGFESALAAAGVEAVESLGRPFDPELHEAVDIVEVEPEREGTVVEEYGRGYRMGNQLLRPARVRVGRGREAQAATE